MSVTPEMLLFLAGKMGLGCPRILYDDVYYKEGWTAKFNPATNDAQFGRLVAMCPSLDIILLITDGYVCASGTNHESPRMEHDSTPDSIRAAAVVAICRALNYEGE